VSTSPVQEQVLPSPGELVADRASDFVMDVSLLMLHPMQSCIAPVAVEWPEGPTKHLGGGGALRVHGTVSIEITPRNIWKFSTAVLILSAAALLI